MQPPYNYSKAADNTSGQRVHDMQVREGRLATGNSQMEHNTSSSTDPKSCLQQPEARTHGKRQKHIVFLLMIFLLKHSLSIFFLKFRTP